MNHARTLPNGLRLLTETIPAARSCAIGLWVELGSRHEQRGEHGLTHFIEHMLFKGTRRRNVRDLADQINFLGGNFNAYTTQEYLCLHAKTIDHKAHETLDLLAEIDSPIKDTDAYEADIRPKILEGGFQLNDFMKKNESFLRNVQDVLELAMMLETQALDLYLRFAEKSTHKQTRDALFTIADEEKVHLNSLGGLLEQKIQTV